MVRKILLILILAVAALACTKVGTLANYTAQTGFGVDIVADYK